MTDSRNYWIKLNRSLLNDDKISFIISEYGHEALTFWIGILTKCDEGIITENEKILQRIFQISDKKFQNYKKIFSEHGLILINSENKIEIKNWHKHQYSDSLERVRKYRENKKIQQSNNDKPASEERYNETNSNRYSNAHVTHMKQIGNGSVTTDIDIELEKDIDIEKDNISLSIKEKEIDKEKEKPLSQPTPQLEAQTDLFADSGKMVEHIGEGNEMVIPVKEAKQQIRHHVSSHITLSEKELSGLIERFGAKKVFIQLYYLDFRKSQTFKCKDDYKAILNWERNGYFEKEYEAAAVHGRPDYEPDFSKFDEEIKNTFANLQFHRRTWHGLPRAEEPPEDAPHPPDLVGEARKKIQERARQLCGLTN